MCDQDQDQPFVASGFDSDHHDCAVCLDLGISQETAGYCTACRMGKRIEQLDQFAEQLKGHGFTEAMRIVYRTTQRTEKAIAAAEKALMMAQHQAQAASIAHIANDLEGACGAYSGDFPDEVARCIDELRNLLPASPVSKQG